MDRIPAIKRGILADLPAYAKVLWTVLAVLLPVAICWLIDGGQGGVEFVTIFPAVVLATLFLGWRSGAAVAVGAGIIANRLFRAEPVLFYADGRDALMVGLYFLTCALLIVTGEMARRLVRQQQEAAEREAMLNQELVHRVKNMLATVNALAGLTARHSGPDEFMGVFTGRMQALEQATGLLASGGAARCDIHQLVDNALAPFQGDGRFIVEGPPCRLPSDSCVPLALALHELCTNASKYGALSVPEGSVSLLWSVDEEEEGVLHLAWQESGGPPVTRPAGTGMGTQLLRAQRGLEHVELQFLSGGVRCEMRIAGTGPGAAPKG